MFSFNEIVNIDKTFRIYDELDEVYSVLITFWEEQKVQVIYIKDDTLTLGINIMSMIGQEKDVEIKLNKKEIGKDIIIKELCNKINLLDKENKDLKEEINIIREELYEIKKWKNEKEEEMNNLFKNKKEKII